MMGRSRGREIENAIIKHLKARKHLNSGAMAEKWDGSTKDLLIEIKSTKAKQYGVNRNYWNSLKKDALRRDKFPVIIVAWDDNKNDIELDDINVVLGLDDFLYIMNYISNEKYNEMDPIYV